MSNPPHMSTGPSYANVLSDANKRSTDFWFSEGRIVIQAEGMQFRIHHDLLSLNSPFFKSMSTLPPPADQPTIDGCPLVLVDDTRKDWENLLTWLYHPSRFLFEDIPLDTLASMLRLGKKYELDEIRGFVLAYFKRRIPTTIDDWTESKFSWDSWIYGQDMELVNFAEEFGMQIILPALYCQCILTAAIVGYTMSEGLVRENGARVCLSLRSQETILASISQIQSNISGDLRTGLDAPTDCLTFVSCNVAKIERIKLYLAYLQFSDLHFAFFPASEEENVCLRELCMFCERRAMMERERNWRVMWSQLPSLFRLAENWDALADFDG